MCSKSFGGVRFDRMLSASIMSHPGIHCVETQYLDFSFVVWNIKTTCGNYEPKNFHGSHLTFDRSLSLDMINLPGSP